MASSKVSCMLVSLLLLVLGLSDMDKALGGISFEIKPIQANFFSSTTSVEKMSVEKLKEFFERAKISQELEGICVNNEDCKSTMNKAYDYCVNAKSYPSDICGNDEDCKSTIKNAKEYVKAYNLKAKSHPSP